MQLLESRVPKRKGKTGRTTTTSVGSARGKKRAVTNGSGPERKTIDRMLKMLCGNAASPHLRRTRVISQLGWCKKGGCNMEQSNTGERAVVPPSWIASPIFLREAHYPEQVGHLCRSVDTSIIAPVVAQGTLGLDRLIPSTSSTRL